MVKRQAQAQEDLERLNCEIRDAERSQASSTTLTKLRSARTTAKETSDDVQMCLEAFPRELELAEGAVIGAKRACTAERYTALVECQRKLVQMISEALERIFQSMKMKESLAIQQRQLLAGIGNYNFSLESVRLATCVELGKRFAIAAGSPERPTSIMELDWTCRYMNRGGGLVD
ncbi:protein of unknown function [Nitrospira japonica]|uniref:Uncharacterized protein n=1 Tax=Nitrospira japonica TaxID=1325564 RepID=A0A1W1I319_9BACT|nr:hypothetical protein [Nitrospira japonica]SLM47400.1 protein of unknown function [Nitrospira japonica]